MPRPTKKKRLDGQQSAAAADIDILVSCFDDLSIDELAHIFGFLPVEDIMRLRRINKKTVEAARITHVPMVDIDYDRFYFFHYCTPGYFSVHSVEKYNAMRNMTTALPNLQQLGITELGERHKYSDGEDPDEGHATETADWTTCDLGIITNFGQLRDLAIIDEPVTGSLNGRYPFLFNSFPLLQKLNIHWCRLIKWDLDMLASLPVLKDLNCVQNSSLTGNINSLKVIKDSLETLVIQGSEGVEGRLMDLADFPHLKVLNLHRTAVTGDIRDMSNNDFRALEKLHLPACVYGGSGHEIERISDAPDLVRAVYHLKKHRPALSMLKNWQGMLSDDSPDVYTYMGEIEDFNEFIPPPLFIRFVEAGSRIGYRWVTRERGEWIDDDEEGVDKDYNPCEVNWLDPEPDRESPDYTKYIQDLERINLQVKFYKGFHEPPSEEEYTRLYEEHIGVR